MRAIMSLTGKEQRVVCWVFFTWAKLYPTQERPECMHSYDFPMPNYTWVCYDYTTIYLGYVLANQIFTQDTYLPVIFMSKTKP